MAQRNPKHQLIGGKHPIIYRVSTILLVMQDFATIHSMELKWSCKPKNMRESMDFSIYFNGFAIFADEKW